MIPTKVEESVDVPSATETPGGAPAAEGVPNAPPPPGDAKGIEYLPPKDLEMITEGDLPRPRRRKVKFGDVHLHLLKAVADADAANWACLQEAIQQAPAASQVKSEFVERLNQLAEARLKSKTEAEAKAEERAQRVKHYTEAETDYRAGLNDQMLRLELANPVGPRTGVPLVSDHRLKQEIEAGRSVWVARRAQRARERAAQHRQEVDTWSRAEKGPGTGPLLDVDLAEAGKVLDKALHDAAQKDLRTFRADLQNEARREGNWNKRAPDTASRKKIKKQRKREGQGHTKDDAERDRNHAIAHQTAEGSSLAGGLSAPNLSNFDQGLKRSPGDALEAEWDLDQASGMIFDSLLLAFILAVALAIRRLLSKWGSNHPGGSAKVYLESAEPERK